jgi:hypothetical protein
MFAVWTELAVIAAAGVASLVVNTTGLPTYPRVRNAMMDAVPRNTLGRQCTHYTSESPDPLDMVEAWYRREVPGAVETNVNQDSIYGSYFNLTGIRLARANDFLMVYRTPSASATSIELFKCGAPAKRAPG